MKQKWLGILLCLMGLCSFVSLAQGNQSIYDTLTKGSRWLLTLDGEESVLELLGGKGAAMPGGGWSMAMEVKWNNTGGILRAQSNGNNTEHKVNFSLHKKNGFLVIAEGFIDLKSNQSMSGTTRYPNQETASPGTWQATLLGAEKPAPEGLERRHGKDILIRQDKELDIQRKKPADTQAPQVKIAVDGILVFTVHDKIKIRGSAEDNGKIAKITLYIDNQSKKTCAAWECYYSEVLTQVGPHTCWATAEDEAGNKGQSKTLEFMVHPTTKPGPALTTRIQPYTPTNSDKITFSASGKHSSGVASITIYINGQEVKTCAGDTCEYIGGPYNSNIQWRVSAKSKDGGETYGNERLIEIKAIQTGTASISGKVFGAGIQAASVFFINLYGPNDLKLFREQTKFDSNGHYSFTGLPNGQYRLRVDTKADIAIGPHPDAKTVQCQGGAVTDVDFELK